MKHNQLLRILDLDSDLIRLSSGGRLMPPENAVCFGLCYLEGISINKMDCKFCILYKTKPPTYALASQSNIVFDVSNVNPHRSNITNRYFCPFCINKEIDKIEESIYYNKILNIILDLYDRLQLNL